MARLLDCFARLISFGQALDASIASGRFEMDCEAAQSEALGLLDEARGMAQALGKSAEQIESARFAMVAWFDEVIARHPDFSGDPRPLQMRLFNSNNAQSEFFHHLSALQPGDDEVREIYRHALALGFKGQYYFEDADSGELGKIKALLAQQMAVRPVLPETLAPDPLALPPHGVPDPPALRDRQSRKRTILRTGGAMALLVTLAYLLWLLLAGPRETPITLAQRVERQLQTYACADLVATVAQDGATRVSGFVSAPEEMARVEREVRAVPGVGSASFDLQLRVWPHCEVLALLKPYQARNREMLLGLGIATPTAPDGRLREGDRVLIRITNANFGGYLWVDFYTTDGAVLHLNAGHAQPRLRAGEAIELGNDLPSSWLVAPPFGTVLLTALSSPTPFNETADRPPFELASAYLQQLRESLVGAEFGAHVIAEFVLLRTVPR